MSDWQIRNIVAEWLNFRLQNDQRFQPGGGGWGDFCGLDRPTLERVIRQVAADAGHSSLLLRMLNGKQPLPKEEYDAARAAHGDAV